MFFSCVWKWEDLFFFSKRIIFQQNFVSWEEKTFFFLCGTKLLENFCFVCTEPRGKRVFLSLDRVILDQMFTEKSNVPLFLFLLGTKWKNNTSRDFFVCVWDRKLKYYSSINLLIILLIPRSTHLVFETSEMVINNHHYHLHVFISVWTKPKDMWLIVI